MVVERKMPPAMEVGVIMGSRSSVCCIRQQLSVKHIPVATGMCLYQKLSLIATFRSWPSVVEQFLS